MIDEYCICGHSKRKHQYPGDTTWVDSWCDGCKLDYITKWPVCEKFKLNNLKLIEDIAKEKGLV